MPLCPVPRVSFEFFPPKSEAGLTALLAAAGELRVLNPDFVTVTFGAGGSTRSGTCETAQALKDRLGLTVGTHLSYFATPKTELMAYADHLWDSGIHHLVVLRGDVPAGVDPAAYDSDEYFQMTSDFVEALRARRDFDISIAAYPEKHPDAVSMAEAGGAAQPLTAGPVPGTFERTWTPTQSTTEAIVAKARKLKNVTYEEMLELAVANGVELVLLSTHSDCAAEKAAASPDMRQRFPALAKAVDEREQRTKEFLARPAIASKIAAGKLAVKLINIDTMTEKMLPR